MRDNSVTVITPALNVAPWLGEAIESVRNQTHTNFRYLIVDNGSTDDTSKIALSHAQDDERVRFLSIRKTGSAYARNAALTGVESDYLAFIDGDDRWDPDFLASGIELLKDNHTLTGVFFAPRNIDENGADLPNEWTLHKPGLFNWADYLLADHPATCGSSLFFRASAFKGHLFDQTTAPSDDYEMWVRVLRENPGTCLLGHPDFKLDYRRRPGQVTEDDPMRTRAIFVALDRIYVRHVPHLKPDDGAKLYSFVAAAAMRRGCPEFAEHFYRMSAALRGNPDFKPFPLEPATNQHELVTHDQREIAALGCRIL